MIKFIKEWPILLASIVFIIGQGLILYFGITSQERRDERRSNYLMLHKCERIGFAGKRPEPVVKCDTGLFLESTLPDLKSESD